jgi:hypothetical protein
MSDPVIESEKVIELRRRLALYKNREEYMLSPEGVQSYGVGTRSLTRYQTDLKTVTDMIAKLEQAIASELADRGRFLGRMIPTDY